MTTFLGTIEALFLLLDFGYSALKVYSSMGTGFWSKCMDGL